MKTKLQVVSADMGKGIMDQIDEIQRKVQHLKEIDEKEKSETMKKINKQKAEMAVKEEEFNAQKQLVTQRYLKLQEQAEKYQSEKEQIERKMNSLYGKVELNEAQTVKLNMIVDRCNT